MPKLKTTATMESCSRAPTTPKITAAQTAPRSAPQETLKPKSKAAAAPISASSPVLCAAKLMLRITMIGAIAPESTPSNRAARMDCCTKSTFSRARVSAHHWPV